MKQTLSLQSKWADSIATFVSEYDIKTLNCNDKNGKITNKAVAHKKLELHEPGKICMSVSTQFRGAKKYQVLILAPKLQDDSSLGVRFYQSPRFLCEYNKKKPHCKLEDPKDIESCDTSF